MTECVDISFNQHGFTMISGHRTCLINHINKGLHIVPKEATNCVTLILTREDHFNQGGEFVRSERAPDQTPTGWNIKVEVEKAGMISTPYDISEGGPKAHRSQI